MNVDPKTIVVAYHRRLAEALLNDAPEVSARIFSEAAWMVPASRGPLQGRAEIAAFWARVPGLARFEMECDLSAYVGSDVIRESGHLSIVRQDEQQGEVQIRALYFALWGRQAADEWLCESLMWRVNQPGHRRGATGTPTRRNKSAALANFGLEEMVALRPATREEEQLAPMIPIIG